MRSRLVLLGFAGLVLALVAGLWWLVHDMAPVVVTVAPGAPVLPPNDAAVVEPTPTMPKTRTGRIDQPIAVTPPPSSTRPTPPSEPSLGEAPAEIVDAGDYLTPTKRGIKTLLRKQVVAIGQYVNDCATKAGGQPTGAAAVTVLFTRGAKGKTVIEVGIDTDNTTLKELPLLDCVRETSRKMVVELPEGVTSISAKHQADFAAGAVTDHKLTAFDVK